MRLKVPPSLLLVTASVTMGFGAIFALLPDFQDAVGFSDFWLGAVTAASFVAGFLSQVGLARFADRGFGRHLLIGGIALSALGMVGVAAAESVGVLFVGRLILGFGQGAFLPAARRVVILRNPTEVGAALGQVGSAATFGFLSGPVVASTLAEAFTLRTPFWVIAGVLVAGLPVVARFAVPPAAATAPVAPLRRLLKLRGVRAGMLLGVGLNVAIGVYDTLWAKFLQDDHGASTQFVGYSLFFFAMPIVILAPVMGRVADRFGPVLLGSLCALASVPFVASYAWLPNMWIISVFALFHSVLDAGGVPSAQSAVARSGPDDLVASGQGLLDGFGLLTAAASALLFAPLYGAYGPVTLWLALAACVGAAGAGAAIVGRGALETASELAQREHGVALTAGERT